MASWSEGGDEEAIDGSLFEGMVLCSPSAAEISLTQEAASPPPADAATTSQPQPQPRSQPIDEDLFSDLTLQTPASPSAVHLDPPTPSPPPPSSSPRPPALTSRQPSRKKKRAVRIGYARETAGGAAAQSEDPHHLSDSLRNKPPPPPSSSGTTAIGAATASKKPMADEPPTSSHDLEVSSAPLPDTAKLAVEDCPPPAPPRLKSVEQFREETDEGSSYEAVVNEDEGRPPPVEEEDGQEKEDKEEVCSLEGSAASEDFFGSAEERVQLVRARISEKLESIRQRAASAYAERKEVEKRQRGAVENVNSASAKHKDLERELELACEAEDFERAERVSENLATVEAEKDKLLLSLRDADADCEVAESKMQEVLELQIAAEEEGITLLEQFAKVRSSQENTNLEPRSKDR